MQLIIFLVLYADKKLNLLTAYVNGIYIQVGLLVNTFKLGKYVCIFNDLITCLFLLFSIVRYSINSLFLIVNLIIILY